MKLDKIEESFKAVYSPIAQAIGNCLITLKNVPVDATAIVSAIVAVAIDMASKTNAIALGQNEKELIDSDHFARFIAFTLTNSLRFSDEMKSALDVVTLAGLKTTSELPN